MHAIKNQHLSVFLQPGSHLSHPSAVLNTANLVTVRMPSPCFLLLSHLLLAAHSPPSTWLNVCLPGCCSYHPPQLYWAPATSELVQNVMRCVLHPFNSLNFEFCAKLKVL